MEGNKKSLWSYLRPYLLYMFLSPFFMFLEVFADLLQPRLMARIVDEGILGFYQAGGEGMHIILSVGAMMVLVVILGGFAGILSGVFANLCSQNFANDIRKDCYQRIMSFSFSQTDRFTTGSLITRVTSDVGQVQQMVNQCIRGFVRTFFLFAGGIVMMLSLDLSFGIIFAIALPIVLGTAMCFVLRANPMYKKLQSKLDGINHTLQENVAAARVVKAYVQKKHEKARFARANDELVDTQLYILLLFSYMIPIMNIFLNLVTVAVIYLGGMQVKAGHLTPGAVMAAITYTTHILGAVMRLNAIFQLISRGTASAGRINELLVCQPDICDGKKEAPVSLGRISFQDVSFSYEGNQGEEVLSHINLDIEPGECIGILGATGSGKSSLVGLLARFYDVTSGAVLLDGMDVRDYRLSELRSRISFALQKSELFSRSIKDNILLGKMDASEEEIKKAAETAQALEFINQRQEGFMDKLAEQGMSLSGGQKQRLSIARAVIKDASVLIFDDATSALDLKTEKRLYDALKGSERKQTKIIIAQRIASVKDADRILVLENGKVEAVGNHEELLRTSLVYKEIYQSQRRGDL